tara:strand:- start:771 stop:1193 length:423 start_codon:yes stop_codon:yes gene_type:complete
MAFSGNKNRIIIPIVEMTPMIDIVFLLIIFFMVAAQFAQEAHVELDLPEEQGQEQIEEIQQLLVINIVSDGLIILDNSKGAISIDQLSYSIGKTLDDGGQWKNISIRADENSRAEVLNKVLKLLNSFGLTATNIATEAIQ